MDKTFDYSVVLVTLIFKYGHIPTNVNRVQLVNDFRCTASDVLGLTQ